MNGYPYSQKISTEERDLLKDCASAYNGWFTQQFLAIIGQVVGNLEPMPEIVRVVESLDALLDALHSARGEFLSEELYPIAKRALTFDRRRRAAEIENRKERIHSPDLLDQLESQLRPFDELMRKDWFRNATPLPGSETPGLFAPSGGRENDGSEGALRPRVR